MPSTDPFAALGLVRGEATERDVKKAYAAKLKSVRPDDDPEGFMALRQHFEHALSQAKWAAQQPEPDPPQQSEQPAVEYKYDEQLGLQFDTSPAGLLIEKTARWIMEEQAEAPEHFLDSLTAEAAFQNSENASAVSHWLRERICEDAGLYDGGDEWEDLEFPRPGDLKRPDWFQDDAVLALIRHFPWHEQRPEDEWQARELNCLLNFIEPVLLQQGGISKRLERHDIQAFRIKDIEEARQDAHGSYYDHQTDEWIDMSPVGVAMRDVRKQIIASDFGNSLERWKSLLARDELQPIEAFQRLDAELRSFICTATGIDDGKKPQRKPWLTDDVVLLLDDTFGWHSHPSGNVWEREEYAWLHDIIAPVRGPLWPESKTELHVPQRLPWFLHFGGMISLYAAYRLILIALEM